MGVRPAEHGRARAAGPAARRRAGEDGPAPRRPAPAAAAEHRPASCSCSTSAVQAGELDTRRRASADRSAARGREAEATARRHRRARTPAEASRRRPRPSRRRGAGRQPAPRGAGRARGGQPAELGGRKREEHGATAAGDEGRTARRRRRTARTKPSRGRRQGTRTPSCSSTTTGEQASGRPPALPQARPDAWSGPRTTTTSCRSPQQIADLVAGRPVLARLRRGTTARRRSSRGTSPTPSRNFTEMMFALAVLDLPFEAGKHDVAVRRRQDDARPRPARSIAFHEEVRPADGPGRQGARSWSARTSTATATASARRTARSSTSSSPTSSSSTPSTAARSWSPTRPRRGRS